ncbi:zinc transporter 2 isoform X2 [Frankliniella occidentalis]|uniref:Zinc transporter 2 isoform X2 n=1 Tax=Frankliniella occidentalis TaxID=133901 RepID=A0A6J1S883_FRAOC|nr:zinc transporter 2 isoform X2 [Frankliniella occidentalis]
MALREDKGTVLDLSERTPLIGRNTDGVYGSLPSTSIPDPGREGKSIIYCVHGKPSGCCLVTKAEVVESTTFGVPLIEHCHRGKRKEVDIKARRQLIIATVLCTLFMIAEIVGGILSHSLAIATDAAHLLTDITSFCISLFSLWVANRPSTRKMNFGWYRAEVIGALTSVLLIWVVTGILVYMAILRIVNKDFEIDATVMLISSALGVVVNLIMGIALHPAHGHSHSGSGAHSPRHSHGSNLTVESEGSMPQASQCRKQNLNVRAAFIHVIGDFIQSIGVLIAALIIYFKPNWIIVDPICTFIFSGLVLITTIAIIRDTIVVLMEGIPRDVDFNAVLDTFMKIDGVVRVHNLRIWALSLEKTALSAHLAIRPGVHPNTVLKTATQNIHANFNFFELTLQIEEFHPNMENCEECHDLSDQ